MTRSIPLSSGILVEKEISYYLSSTQTRLYVQRKMTGSIIQ